MKKKIIESKHGVYRIVIDYGAYEGMKFWDEIGYETVSEAVNDAIKCNFGSPFFIVRIVAWEAQEIAPDKTTPSK